MRHLKSGRRTPGGRHPETQEMLAYLESTLEAKRRLALETHLASPCFECQGRLREFGRLLEHMRGDRTPPVPEALHRIALDAFEAGGVADAPAPLGERIARLLLDTLGRPASFAVSRSIGEVRRLRFDAGGMPVELECELESAGRYVLRGRVGDTDAGPCVVRVGIGEERFEARPDAAGLFVLSGLPEGRGRISIETPSGTWRLPEFDLEVG